MIRAVWAAALVATCGAAPLGLKVPPSASEYRSHASTPRFDIGARLLTPEQVRAGFATELNRHYLVVEVAVYPKGDLELSPAGFALRVAGARDLLRPVAARVAAARLQKDAPRGRDIDLYPVAGVGYGRYGGRGVWDTSAGVGVGIGNGPPPASTDQDRRTMEAELSEQAFPDGRIAQPVAGYLYFAAPKRRNVTFDLEYLDRDPVILPLVTP